MKEEKLEHKLLFTINERLMRNHEISFIVMNLKTSFKLFNEISNNVNRKVFLDKYKDYDVLISENVSDNEFKIG